MKQLGLPPHSKNMARHARRPSGFIPTNSTIVSSRLGPAEHHPVGGRRGIDLQRGPGPRCMYTLHSPGSRARLGNQSREMRYAVYQFTISTSLFMYAPPAPTRQPAKSVYLECAFRSCGGSVFHPDTCYDFSLKKKNACTCSNSRSRMRHASRKD